MKGGDLYSVDLTHKMSTADNEHAFAALSCNHDSLAGLVMLPPRIVDDGREHVGRDVLEYLTFVKSLNGPRRYTSIHSFFGIGFKEVNRTCEAKIFQSQHALTPTNNRLNVLGCVQLKGRYDVEYS
jgi:hypothetical protein